MAKKAEEVKVIPELPDRSKKAIKKILIQTQFVYWIDKDAKTAEEINSHEQRAIEYYLGISKNPKELISYEQNLFHGLIDSQMALIIQALKGE